MISLNEIKCFILDMDGTIYLGGSLIGGAKELIVLFESRNIPYYFFTNNTSNSTEFYVEKLQRLGFENIPNKRIITAADVTANYIIDNYGSGAKAYIVGTESLVERLMKDGIIYTDSGIPDCVVVGFDTTLTYEKITKAVGFIRAGVPFIATHIDAVCPIEGGAVLPDCGSICAMLTHATGVKPKFLGKPTSETAEYIKQVTKINASEIAMIGDRIYTDMRFAVDNGMCSIGVLSGEMSLEDINKSGMKLDYIFDSVTDVYNNLKSNK
jgi:HAD superfamily hydrolase (TIGR01450 family)